jgi:hypothetical protein
MCLVIDVPHVFCPRSRSGASFKNARVILERSRYGKRIINVCQGRNYEEIRDGV